MSLERMKTHKVFKEFDFTVPIRERFLNSTAPFIPTEPVFNEQADRDSEQLPGAKPKNILAAIMGNPAAEAAGEPARPTWPASSGCPCSSSSNVTAQIASPPPCDRLGMQFELSISWMAMT